MSGHARPDVTVMVCRDCCCGSASKHPRTDHDAQRDRLTGLAGPTDDRVRVRVVDCLDECDRSNVVLVRDHRRPTRARDTWLGGVLDDAVVDELAAWVADDDAAPSALPPSLAGRAFRRRGPSVR